MNKKYYAQKGETLDALCWRVSGQTAGLTEQTLALNPMLAQYDCFLPTGTIVEIPAQKITVSPTLIQLWD